MRQDKRAASERQLALLETIAANPGISRETVGREVPAYSNCASAGAFQRMFERDVSDLRDAGYPIIAEAAGYFLRPASRVEMEVSALDAGLIRSLLSALPSGDARAKTAGNGLLKLLSDARDDRPQAQRASVIASIPTGTEVIGVAQALGESRRVAFDYQRGPDTVKHYQAEPWALFHHFGAFYFSGWARSGQTWGERTFRLDRIIDGSLTLGEEASHAREQGDSSTAFTSDYVVLSIADGEAEPLRTRGEKLASTEPGFAFYEYRDYPKNRLFEDLCLYGSSVRIAAPAELRAEWEARVAHLGAVARADSEEGRGADA